MPRLIDTVKNEVYVQVLQKGDVIDCYLVDGEGTPVPQGMLFRIHADGSLVLYSGVDTDAAAAAGIKLGDFNRIECRAF